MQKRLVIGLIVSIFLFTAVFANPNPSVSLTPNVIYETNELWFNVTIDNFLRNEVISNVEVTLTNLEVTAIQGYIGWDDTRSQYVAEWQNGTIETNVVDAQFAFSAKAGLVSSNQTVIVPVVTTGPGGDTTDNVQIIIANDETPPVLTDESPANGSFILAGSSSETVSINATDPETGILNVSFRYWNCSVNATNVTIYSTVLGCAGDICAAVIDVSGYDEGDNMCIEYEGYNNALDSTTVSGTVGFDATPPTVTLLAPSDDSYANDATLFQFRATDNLAPTLTCNFTVDSAVISTMTVANGTTANVTYNVSLVSEGSHDWTVACADGVGLSASATEWQFIYDVTAPTITLNSPANGSTVANNTLIDVSVTDNFEIDHINFSQSNNTADWSEGTGTLTVDAADKAGNTATATFEFTVDKTDPTLNIIAPADNASNDVHVNFTFNVTDNIDTSITCGVYIDSALYTEENVSNGVNIISSIVPMGDYNWTVRCTDDAGNSIESGSRVIHIVDLTGPDIAMSDIVYVARTEDYAFTATVTDPSGVDTVDAVFDSGAVALTASGNDSSGTIVTNINHTLGTYNLTITANDTLANPSSLIDVFTLIQGYVITLNLNPSSASPSASVTASGTVTYDNGTTISDTNGTIYLPGSNASVEISGGSFSHVFSAPGSDGTYDIIIGITSSEGYEHTQTAQLTVSSGGSGAGISSSDSNGGSGGGSYCGNGVCEWLEDCSSCSSDCGECDEEEEEEESEGPQVPGSGYCGDGVCQWNEECDACSYDCGYCLEEDEVEEDEVEDDEQEDEEERSPAPVGAAVGWFNLSTVSKSVWAVLLFGAILGVLAYFGKLNGYDVTNLFKRKKSNSNIDWKNYFDSRR